MQVYQHKHRSSTWIQIPGITLWKLSKRIPTFVHVGGWQKFLYNFGMIGPLAFRPLWGFCHIWYVLRSPLRPLARPCIFDASRWCSPNLICPEDVIERTVFVYKSPYPNQLSQPPHNQRGDFKTFWKNISEHICQSSWQFFQSLTRGNLHETSTTRPRNAHGLDLQGM